MTPHYEDGGLRLFHGSNKDVLPTFDGESFDSIVCDPPYEIGFMGKGWDSTGIAYDTDMWRECYRVLKPGGFLLAFGGTRTWHRIAAAIEDAGFEIRDSIAWMYAQGFPKSMDVGKAVEKSSNAESAENADRWKGWGTVLKPSFEPVIVARKPLVGALVANVLMHGVGALNIDGCRVAAQGRPLRIHTGTGDAESIFSMGGSQAAGETHLGRWPTNVLLDEGAAEALNRQAGPSVPAGNKGPLRRNTTDGYGGTFGTGEFGLHPAMQDGDDSRVSRFFPTFRYEAKAPSSERPEVDGVAHATVKPLALMRWLVRLVTRRGGHVLDPFAGSGTTGEAALLEGMNVTLIELESAHLPLIMQRVHKPLQPSMFGDWEAS